MRYTRKKLQQLETKSVTVSVTKFFVFMCRLKSDCLSCFLWPHPHKHHQSHDQSILRAGSQIKILTHPQKCILVVAAVRLRWETPDVPNLVVVISTTVKQTS